VRVVIVVGSLIERAPGVIVPAADSAVIMLGEEITSDANCVFWFELVE
jgi:hypothetical protein